MANAGLTIWGDDNDYIPTFAVSESAGDVTIPLEIFPEWLNDAGESGRGGARYISIFDAASAEGVSTTRVTSTLQQDISSVGGIVVPSPSFNELYDVIIRLRSELNDTNFVSRRLRFRLATPLGVPVKHSAYADDQIPDMTFVGSRFQFLAPAGTFPAGEAKLYNGRGGITLPSAALTDWPTEAENFINEKFATRLNRGFLTVEFGPSAGAESWTRAIYHVEYTPAGGTYVFTTVRRTDYSNGLYWDGVAIDFADTFIDMTRSIATMRILRGIHSIGPRFNQFIVAGNAGSMTIDPAIVEGGGDIDITPVIDFEHRSHLTATGRVDKFVTVCVQTPSKTLIQEIPLRPEGQWDTVEQDGVTNYFNAFAADALPSSPPLFFRTLVGPYLTVPNVTQFYDTTQGGFTVGPPAKLPQITTINVYDENAAIPAVTYADVPDMVDQMFGIEMPRVGYQTAVLDLRTLRRDAGAFTPIDIALSSWIRVEMTVDPGATFTFTTGNGVDPSPGETFSFLPSGATGIFGGLDAGDSTTGTVSISVTAGTPAPGDVVTGLTSTFSATLTAFTAALPAYVIDAQYDLNADGQPRSWRLDPATTFVDVPQLTYDRDAHTLTADIVAGTTINAAATVRGDLGAQAIVLTAPGTTVIPQATIDQVSSEEAELLEVEFSNADGFWKRRVATTATDFLVQGTPGNEIDILFTGTSILFRTVGVVDVQANGQRQVAIVGEGPPQPVYDVNDGQLVFMNAQQGSTIAQNIRRSFVDILYEVGGVLHRYRAYTLFFDATVGRPRTILSAPATAFGAPADSFEFVSFSPPRCRIDLASRELEFETDARVFPWREWVVHNGVNGEETRFTERPAPGRKYQLGLAGQGLSINNTLTLSAQHRTGSMRTWTFQVDTANFVTPTPVFAAPNP